ncbi:MAG: hypothetical protein AB7K24_01500 [Gemmataceae bacterium]
MLRHALLLTAVLFSVDVARGGDAMKLVNDRAVHTVATGNYDACLKNMDRFCEDFLRSGPFSHIVDDLARQLGVPPSRKQGGALAYLSIPLGDPADGQRHYCDVIVVEVDKPDMLAALLGFKPDELKPQTLLRVKNEKLWTRYVWLRGKVAFLGRHERAVHHASHAQYLAKPDVERPLYYLEEALARGIKIQHTPLEAKDLAALGLKQGLKPGGLAVVYRTATEYRDDLVVVVEIEKLEPVAEHFGLAKDGLPRNKVVEVKVEKPPQTVFWDMPRKQRFICVQDNLLFIALQEEALDEALKGKPVAETLDPALLKSLQNAGLLVHESKIRQSKKQVESSLDWFKRVLLPACKTEAERAVANAFFAAAPDLEHAFICLRYDDHGLHLSLAPVFAKNSKPAQELLAGYRRADKASFRGLPTGDVLLVESSLGDRGKGLTALSVFARGAAKQFSFFLPKDYGADWSHLVTLGTEITHEVAAARFALYRTETDSLALVGILDAQDPERFLADLKKLARLAHFDGLDVNQADQRKLIEQLVAELGAEEYRLREAASARLRIVGERAIPFLKAAREDPDLERARRAERLLTAIAEEIKERRQPLRDPQQLASLKPSFAFLDKQEERAGCKVYQLGVVFPGEADAGRDKLLRGLFGPDWQRVRVAVCGKQVVVLVGSELALLDQALVNLKEGKPGLADTPLYQFAGAKPHTRLQFSLTDMLAMTRVEGLEAKKRPAADPSGLQFEVGPHHAVLDITVSRRDLETLSWMRQRFPW